MRKYIYDVGPDTYGMLRVLLDSIKRLSIHNALVVGLDRSTCAHAIERSIHCIHFADIAPIEGDSKDKVRGSACD